MTTVSEHSFTPTAISPADKQNLDALLEARHALALADAQLRDPAFIDAIADKETRFRARDTFAKLQPAILAIDNARIEMIVAKMAASSTELREATKELKVALAKVQQVSSLLDTITRVLGVISNFLVVF